MWRAGAIGPLSLPHRIVMGSMHLGLEGLDDDGAALAAFYRERALGGAGLIVTGGSAVSRVGAGGRNYSFINESSDAVKLGRVAAAIHDAGGLVLLQLFHAGRYAYEASFGLTPVAPSPVYSRYSRCEPRELSGDEVLETISDFARGARRARELGFDGVEIMGSEGYLIDQFLAPATNLRDDEWGGDSERRARFALEVAAAVREAGGPGQAVVFRMSGASFVEGGGTSVEAVELARALSSAGSVDAINVGMGWHESRVPTVQALVPHGAWRPWARAVREAVDVPVIASNRINTIALADEVLAGGDADFVSMARPFLADPEIIAKSRDRRKLNICIACNQACIDRSIFDERVSCVVNPRAGYELELGGRAERAHSVAVVGGGPGRHGGRARARRCGTPCRAVRGRRIGSAASSGWRAGSRERRTSRGRSRTSRPSSSGWQSRCTSRPRCATRSPLAEFDAVVVATGVAAPAGRPAGR